MKDKNAMKLDQLKAMIEAEAFTRQAARDGFTLDAVKAWLGTDAALPPTLQRSVPQPPTPLTWHYFACLDGGDLVTACYTLLLGRTADPAGFQNYLKQLQEGEEKMLIVGRIAYSPEGRQRGAPVSGLFLRVALASLRKLPIIGSLFALATGILFMNGQQRQVRAQHQQVLAKIRDLTDYSRQSGERVAMKVDALRSILATRD